MHFILQNLATLLLMPVLSFGVCGGLALLMQRNKVET